MRGVNCDFNLTTTFGSSNEYRDTAVSVWGFRGPLGCFVAALSGYPARRRCRAG
jgi:hypothetical protein